MWAVILLVVSLAWAVSWEEFQKKYEEFLEKFRGYKPPGLSEDKKKKLEEDVKKLQENAQRSKGMFEVQEGQVRFKGGSVAGSKCRAQQRDCILFVDVFVCAKGCLEDMRILWRVLNLRAR